MKCIPPIKVENMVLGQYVGDKNHESHKKYGYLDDNTVPNGSKTATYAVAVLNIKNERWDGVPFVLKCGKGESLSFRSIDSMASHSQAILFLFAQR